MAREAAAAAGVEAEFVKVTNIDDILAYDVFASPALVIDDKVVSTGRIPSAAEIGQWLARRGATADEDIRGRSQR